MAISDSPWNQGCNTPVVGRVCWILQKGAHPGRKRKPVKAAQPTPAQAPATASPYGAEYAGSTWLGAGGAQCAFTGPVVPVHGAETKTPDALTSWPSLWQVTPPRLTISSPVPGKFRPHRCVAGYPARRVRSAGEGWCTVRRLQTVRPGTHVPAGWVQGPGWRGLWVSSSSSSGDTGRCIAGDYDRPARETFSPADQRQVRFRAQPLASRLRSPQPERRENEPGQQYGTLVKRMGNGPRRRGVRKKAWQPGPRTNI